MVPEKVMSEPPLGMGHSTKTDEFSKKFQTGFAPSPHFRKILLRMFYNGFGDLQLYLFCTFHCQMNDELTTESKFTCYYYRITTAWEDYASDVKAVMVP